MGVDVHRAARIAAAGHGRQVLVSASTAALVETGTLSDLGEHPFSVPANPFLGRQEDLTAVADKLQQADHRLLTLTGPGGTGKTRLALQAAADAVEEFPDGMTWIPLAPLGDPTLVLATIALALGLEQDVSGRSRI